MAKVIRAVLRGGCNSNAATLPDPKPRNLKQSLVIRAAEKYMYEYNVQSLASGAQYLSGFVAQNFASDVEPMRITNIYIGKMASDITEFFTEHAS